MSLIKLKGRCKDCRHWVKPKTAVAKSLAEWTYSHAHRSKFCDVHECIMFEGNGCMKFEGREPRRRK